MNTEKKLGRKYIISDWSCFGKTGVMAVTYLRYGRDMFDPGRCKT